MTVLRLPGDIRERTVRDVLDERAVSRAGHVALIAPSLVHGGTVELTYAELQAAAGELAAVFAAAGVGKGDRVAIMLDNHGAAEAHVAYHASHRVGAINVPINARYVPRELRYVLGFVEPAAIVFAGRFAPVLAELDDVLAGAVRLEIADEPALGTAYAAAIAGRGRLRPIRRRSTRTTTPTGSSPPARRAIPRRSRSRTPSRSPAATRRARRSCSSPTASISRSRRSSPAPAATRTCSAASSPGARTSWSRSSTWTTRSRGCGATARPRSS